MRIAIQIINKCNLLCKSCFYKDIKAVSAYPEKVLSLEEFKYTVNKCIEFGFDTFELTPIVGEVFLDVGIYEKLKYLSDNKKVKSIVLTTNLTTNILPEKLKNIKKLLLTISIYGSNRLQYKETTGVDLYNVWIKNFNSIISLDINFEFGWRYNFKKTDDIYILTKFLVQSNSKKFHNLYGDVIDHNCGGFYSKINSNEEYICEGMYLENSILTNGNIVACATADIFGENVIGSIHDDLSEVYSKNSILSGILHKQLSGDWSMCNGCNAMRPASEKLNKKLIDKVI